MHSTASGDTTPRMQLTLASCWRTSQSTPWGRRVRDGARRGANRTVKNWGAKANNLHEVAIGMGKMVYPIENWPGMPPPGTKTFSHFLDVCQIWWRFKWFVNVAPFASAMKTSPLS